METDIREAIRFHIDGLRTDGASVPEPTSIGAHVEAEAIIPPVTLQPWRGQR